MRFSFGRSAIRQYQRPVKAHIVNSRGRAAVSNLNRAISVNSQLADRLPNTTLGITTGCRCQLCTLRRIGHCLLAFTLYRGSREDDNHNQRQQRNG